MTIIRNRMPTHQNPFKFNVCETIWNRLNVKFSRGFTMCEIIHTISNLSGKLQAQSKSVLMMMMNQVCCCCSPLFCFNLLFSAIWFDTHTHSHIVIIYPLAACQLEHYVLKVNSCTRSLHK